MKLVIEISEERYKRIKNSNDDYNDYIFVCEAILNGIPLPKGQEWIPFTYRPMTDKEKVDYSNRTGYDIEDLDSILNCPLPEDGETVLITDRLGNVETDMFINDCDGCCFEYNIDMEDVIAWMPLPKPYEADKENADEDSD